MMNSKVYDVLKQLAQLWIPALGTLYTTIGVAVNLPTEVPAAIILAVDTFLGAILAYYKAQYDKSQEGESDGK